MTEGVVLLTGAGGQLGRALLATAASDTTIVPLSSADLDITDAAAVDARLAELGPHDVVINCAAYTKVDDAETDRDGATAVNVVGPTNLAAACARTGAWLIHISTDYVFGGPTAGEATSEPIRTEPYEPDELIANTPPTVYGATKLAGERAAQHVNEQVTVVRTAWVYTGRADSADFIGTMRRLSEQHETLRVVDDQRGSPTYAFDLARGLWELVGSRDTERRGVVLHATNGGSASWFELTRELFVGLGLDPKRVEPTTTADFPRPAPRPAFSVLSQRSWVDLGLTPLPDWRVGLAEAIAASGTEPSTDA